MENAFSVIMPTYNRRNCIKDSVDSFLRQERVGRNDELIIIDDGSTDGTEDFIRETYGRSLESGKIRFYKLPENRGASYARNEGLSRSKNGWIAYLDSDNKMRRNFLDVFSKAMDAYPLYQSFYAKIRHLSSGLIVGHGFDFDELAHDNYIDLGAFVHSRNLYEEMGGFDINLKRLIDWDLILRYSERYVPRFIDEILVDYHDGIGVSRISTNVPYEENYKNVVLKYLARLGENDFRERYAGCHHGLKAEKLKNEKLTQELKMEGGLVKNLAKTLNEKNRILKEKDEEIAGLKREVNQRNEEISFMESSKFWKCRNWYMRFKWAVQHPVRFFRKHSGMS